MAILAGDGLFAEAIRLFAEGQGGEPDQVLAALGELTAATGVGGMVGGQYVDVTAGEELDAERLAGAPFAEDGAADRAPACACR